MFAMYLLRYRYISTQHSPHFNVSNIEYYLQHGITFIATTACGLFRKLYLIFKLNRIRDCVISSWHWFSFYLCIIFAFRYYDLI